MTHAHRTALTGELAPPSCPVVELTAPTRREEARAVMATIREVRDRGVDVRDIVVVARDLDPYEQPLTRAAIQYGVTPVFWTQLRVTRTEPYAVMSMPANTWTWAKRPAWKATCITVCCRWPKVPRWTVSCGVGRQTPPWNVKHR